jgi:deoxycytidylate deaminase
MTADSLELQLAITLRRFTALHRHLHEHDAESSRLLASALKELERALQVVHAAQDALVENYRRLDHTQAELAEQYEKYWRLFEDMPQPILRPWP